MADNVRHGGPPTPLQAQAQRTHITNGPTAPVMITTNPNGRVSYVGRNEALYNEIQDLLENNNLHISDYQALPMEDIRQFLEGAADYTIGPPRSQGTTAQ